MRHKGLLERIALAGARLILVASVLGTASCGQFLSDDNGNQRGGSGVVVPFHPKSIWNRRIEPQPKIRPNSDNMVRLLLTGYESTTTIPVVLPGVNELWSAPVYYADATTPKRRVCHLSEEIPCEDEVPLPDEILPDPTTDGNAVVIDMSVTPPRAWSFWRLSRPAGGSGDWLAGTSGWANISQAGDGIRNRGVGKWGGRASGFNKYAGLITPEEIRKGRIDHALVLSIDGLVVSKNPEWPAVMSDGYSEDPNAIPMGARFQLDPSINVDSLDLSAGGKVIARALQTYGAWLGDTGSATAIYAQEFLTVDSDGQVQLDPLPWQGLLSGEDLSRFPASSLRVIEVGRGDFYEE